MLLAHGVKGYDRRALPAWTVLAWVLLVICFFLMPPPRPDPGLQPVNINYVWGMSDNAPQTWVSPWVWFFGLIVGLPILLFTPVHFLMMRIAPRARETPT